MRFNVSGKSLQVQLQAVSKVINSKNALAILDNFLLQVEGNTLSIIGGDQENVMRATVEINDADGEGEIAILAKRLLEVVKEVSNQPLTFDINLDTKEIELTFNNGHFSFMGVDAAEYPRRKAQRCRCQWSRGHIVCRESGQYPSDHDRCVHGYRGGPHDICKFRYT